MSKCKSFLILLLLSLCTGGCIEAVDISPEPGKKIVVNCLLDNSEVQTLHLTYVSSFEDTYYKEVEVASISLFEEGVEVGVFTKEDFSAWQLKYRPKPGKKYEIRVEIPGEPTISASTSFPFEPPIVANRGKDVDGRRYFEKKSGTPIFWIFALKNPKTNHRQLPIIESHYKLIAEIGTDYKSVDPFNKRPPSDSPDATTNLQLGYLRMLPNKRVNQFYVEKWLYHCVVVFRAVSDEYDQYLKSSVSKMLVYNSFNDPTQWLDESEIYSNINNGVGVFGAYNDRIFAYDRE